MRLPLVLALLAACGGTTATTTGTTTPKGHGEGHGSIDIRKAALPYRILRARGGAELTEAEFFAELGAADAVCLGESHRNPHDHWVQLMVLERLTEQAGGSGRQLAVGMEMFQRPFQGVVDDYAAGRIDEKAFLQRTGWEERWGFDYGFYKPMIDLAVGKKLPVLALNMQSELTRKVGKGGLAALSASERAELPELVLDDATHRAWFQEATAGHGGPADDSFENFYTAQVIWDETMADTSWRWLGAQGSPRQIAILAGTGHCMDAAIPGRLRRRGAQKVLSIQAVMDDGASAVPDLLAAPENDYLIVLDPGAS